MTSEKDRTVNDGKVPGSGTTVPSSENRIKNGNNNEVLN